MRCIFCKKCSDNSKSIEHIIPESLGNKDHTLSPGWVCDSCNNYLSRNVEAPFLNSHTLRNSRFSMSIPSKKGRIPRATSYMHGNSIPLDILLNKYKEVCISPTNEKDIEKFIDQQRRSESHGLILPTVNAPKITYEVSRFIGKIAIEILASRLSKTLGANDELVDKAELDELRDYVRRGKPDFIWPVNIRSIYLATKVFNHGENHKFEILHEFDILFIPAKKDSLAGEYYAVVAIFGIEYVINLSNPDVNSYKAWLKSHNDVSPLCAC